MASLGYEAQQLFDVMDESHVKHLVCLIKHEMAKMFEVDIALIVQVKQSSRGCDEDVYTAFELLYLRVLPNTTIDYSTAYARVGAVVLDVVCNLYG